MQAAIDGGFKIVEFTLTTPNCLDHLSDFRAKYDGDVMVVAAQFSRLKMRNEPSMRVPSLSLHPSCSLM
jgi:hypothetical protein